MEASEFTRDSNDVAVVRESVGRTKHGQPHPEPWYRRRCSQNENPNLVLRHWGAVDLNLLEEKPISAKKYLEFIKTSRFPNGPSS